METKTFFDGLRSLVNVAEDVTSALTDGVSDAVNSLLVKVDTFIDDLESEYEDVLAEQEESTAPVGELSRERMAHELYAYLVSRDNLWNDRIDPSNPQHHTLSDNFIKNLYNFYVVQGN